MAVLGKILCCNRAYASEHWCCDHFPGISRLYFVHQGTGGCLHNGQTYCFRPGKLYFIPYAPDYKPFSHPEDPILHTYADFERIPPVLTNRILSADPAESPAAEAALKLFCLGAETQEAADADLIALRTESILYLSSFAAKQNGVSEISDPELLQILARIHQWGPEPFSVEKLADEFYRSEDGLIRKFKKHLGITPYAYAKNLKLAKARRLKDEGWSLDRIARETGYGDAAALSHALIKQKKHPSVDFEQKNNR